MQNTKKTSKKPKIPSMEYWNYRVINCDGYHSIHEVHYDKKNKPIMWSEEALIPVGESFEELKSDLLHYMLAIARPVLIIKKNKLYEEN